MLPRLCLLFLLLTSVARLAAQPAGAAAPHPRVVGIGVLPDRGYRWASIRADTALPFAPADSLHPALARRYWLQLTIRNPSHYPAATHLTVLPNLDNTLFYFDRDARAWRTRRAGVVVATDSQRSKGPLALLLPGHAATTVYVLVNLATGARLPPAVRLRVRLETGAAARQADERLRLAWVVSLGVLGLLLLTNLPTYLRYRDRATLFYLCTQVGAVLYVTAYRSYFRVRWPAPVFSQRLLPTGYAHSYTVNNVLMHLSVGLLLLGFVQLTRAYLATPAHLPRLDAALRRALAAYLAFTAVVMAVNLSGFLLNYYTLRFDNLLVFGLIGLLLATAVAAYRRRLPLARPYLLANALPLLGVLGVAAYHVAVGFGDSGAQWLPDVAIVMHAVFFSVALSVRLHGAQQALLVKEHEAATLALDIERQQLRQREIVLQNSHIQAVLRTAQQASEQQARQLGLDVQQQQQANQQLQGQLEANQRELASTSLYVQQKNALLAELRQQIQELGTQGPPRPQELTGIKSLLQSSLYLDEDWSKFKLHFEQVHPRFFEDLQVNYPTLTKNEQRLYCYFHINLSTKEIAALLNIDPASVRRAKTRLFKKIAAADETAGRPAATPAAE